MGIVHNGDAVAEAATFQLPTIILDSASFGTTYYNYLWNFFRNDLNIAKKGEIYPELIHTRAHPVKIGELLS